MTKKNKKKTAKKKKNKVEFSPSLMIISIIILFVLTGISKIALSNSITEMSYTYEILKRREVKYGQQVIELKSNIIELNRSDRIRSYAKRKLNMQEYNPDTRVLKID